MIPGFYRTSVDGYSGLLALLTAQNSQTLDDNEACYHADK
jgi:hypothetical protein